MQKNGHKILKTAFMKNIWTVFQKLTQIMIDFSLKKEIIVTDATQWLFLVIKTKKREKLEKKQPKSD